MSRGPAKVHRGSVGWYVPAFLLVLASTVLLYYGVTRQVLEMVWTSIGLSGLSILVAVASLLVRARLSAPEGRSPPSPRSCCWPVPVGRISRLGTRLPSVLTPRPG